MQPEGKERNGMEHRFGIFETVEELNRAAAVQKAEGDEEALFALAAENGICREDAEDYLDGAAEELATPLMAALGKLDMEAAELGLKSQLADWKGCIAAMCSDDEALCHAVFRPEKELAYVLAEGIRHASKNRVGIPARIIQMADIPAGSAIGMTGRDELRRIAYRYYTGEGGKT